MGVKPVNVWKKLFVIIALRVVPDEIIYNFVISDTVQNPVFKHRDYRIFYTFKIIFYVSC